MLRHNHQDRPPRHRTCLVAGNNFDDLTTDDEPPEILPFVMAKASISVYRQRCWKRDPHCVYCGKLIPEGQGTAEHAVPKSKGGTNSPWNLWLCCGPCNSERSSQDLAEWAANLRRSAEEMKVKADRVEAAGVRMGLIAPPVMMVSVEAQR